MNHLDEPADLSTSEADPPSNTGTAHASQFLFLFALLLLGAACIALSLSLRPGHGFDFLALLHEFGIAMVTVAIAVMTVEQVRTRMFTDELKRVASDKAAEIEKAARDGILRGALPPIYFQHVMRILLDKRVYRDNWRIRLKFVSVGNGWFKLLFDQSYSIVNASGKLQEYKVVAMETAIGQHADRAGIRYCRARFRKLPKFEIDKVSTPETVIGERKEDEITFEQSIPLPPKSELIVETGTVTWVRADDMMYLIAVDPATNARWVIERPNNLKMKLEFPENPSQLTEYKPLGWKERIAPDIVRETWDFPFPIIPSNSIICYWLLQQSPPQPAEDAVVTELPQENS